MLCTLWYNTIAQLASIKLVETLTFPGPVAVELIARLASVRFSSDTFLTSPHITCKTLTCEEEFSDMFQLESSAGTEDINGTVSKPV